MDYLGFIPVLTCLSHAVTYHETTMPVIEHYRKQDKVAEVCPKNFHAIASLIHFV